MGEQLAVLGGPVAQTPHVQENPETLWCTATGHVPAPRAGKVTLDLHTLTAPQWQPVEEHTRAGR